MGEFGLIDLLAKIAPQGVPEHRKRVGIGDDAAAWYKAYSMNNWSVILVLKSRETITR